MEKPSRVEVGQRYRWLAYEFEIDSVSGVDCHCTYTNSGGGFPCSTRRILGPETVYLGGPRPAGTDLGDSVTSSNAESIDMDQDIPNAWER